MKIVFILMAITALGALALISAIKFWPKGAKLTAEERKELSAGPKPVLQKRAWAGFFTILLTMGLTFGMVSNYGAATYYQDDTVRMIVMGVFLAGIALYALIVPASLLGMRSKGNLDERDQGVLNRAPSFQSAAMLGAYAAWSIYLMETYREEGGIPGEYLFLIFGTLVLVNLLAHAVGILSGYWMSNRHA